MTIDLTQFHDAFFEESFEALDSMEAALLKLDIGAPEPELINTIFRVAHSIKGGSATFGFSDIASFTHSLETLLDELRSGGMQVTLAISDLLLKSVDVMRAMLKSTQSKQPLDMQRVSDLQFDLELMIAQKNATPAPTAVPEAIAHLAAAPAPAARRGNARPAPASDDIAPAAPRGCHYHPRCTRLGNLLPSVSRAVRSRQRPATNDARAGRSRRADRHTSTRAPCPPSRTSSRRAAISPGTSSSTAMSRKRPSNRFSNGPKATATWSCVERRAYSEAANTAAASGAQAMRHFRRL